MSHPEVEFKDECLSTARSVIEPCLVKAGYEPCFRTSFYWEIFLFQRHWDSIQAQPVFMECENIFLLGLFFSSLNLPSLSSLPF